MSKSAIAIIPARAGSKRIPKKNIKFFFGKPLIAYSIEVALESKLFEKVIVTTDDEKIAKIAEEYGAEVPFLRPRELSDDFTGTQDVINHTIEYLQTQGEEYEYVCTIYATAPLLQKEYLIEGYEKLRDSDAINAFSATSMPFPIQRTFKLNDHGRCEMFTPEHYMTRSQDLEEAYQDAGQFYWENRKLVKESKNRVLFSDLSIPIILPRYLVQDIDTLEDWERAEFMYQILNDKHNSLNFLGYKVIINYGDYDTIEVVIEELGEIESICKNIETDDKNFNIEYKEKYEYNNKILYTASKYKQIENKNIPKDSKYIENIYSKANNMYDNDSINKKDVEPRIEDL